MFDNALQMMTSAQKHLIASDREDSRLYYLRLCERQLSMSLAVLRHESNPVADEVEMALEHLIDCIKRPHNDYAHDWLVSHLNKALACMCAPESQS